VTPSVSQVALGKTLKRWHQALWWWS